MSVCTIPCKLYFLFLAKEMAIPTKRGKSATIMVTKSIKNGAFVPKNPG